MSDAEVADRLSRGLSTASWHYRTRVTVHAPASVISARLPAAITVEPVDDNTCVIDAGSDSPHMLALYLGMIDADFEVDPASAPVLAEHLRKLADRYGRSVSPSASR
jgi:hypothetical protein